MRFYADKGDCLSETQAATTLSYDDSQAGGGQPKGSTGCPVTTSGTARDSMTG